jgi:2-polyprenyl-3-methyl-5-hydroxy-6-metoxy-1,4-benzoquinol methylase
MKGSIHIPYDLHLRPYHEVIAKKAIELLPPGGKLIEIGCGVGLTLQLIRNKRPDAVITAVDIDQSCLDITSKRVPDAQLIQINEKTGIEGLDNGYDICIASHVLEHLKNPYETVLQMMNLIKKDGYLLLAVPNPVRPNIFMGNIFKKDYVNRGHVYAWDRSHWINFLERILNLNVVEYPVDFIPVFPFNKFKKQKWSDHTMKLFAKVVPWWSFSNMAVVKK